MNNNPNQATEFDAVLGGEAPPPANSIVLGGIEGVKSRLKSSREEVRVAALNDAINYGDAGLDLVIEALEDSSKQVKDFAAKLLKQRGGEKGKQALLNFNPWLLFTKLENWTREDFDPTNEINISQSKAYAVNLERLHQLLKYPQVDRVEALICEIDNYDYNDANDGYYDFINFVNTISDARDKLANLKSLFIGNKFINEFMKFYLELGNITPVLENFPQLQVLHVRGGWGLEIRQIQHKNLKTLVVETGLICIDTSTIEQISKLDLPALEYLELWLGGSHRYCCDVSTKYLLPILAGEVFPSLKYLGLRSSDYSDNIALCLAELPTIIDRLAVLDLSMGTLTDDGARALLNFPPINQIHTLDVSINCLSTNMIEELSQLNCHVIAETVNEESELGDRYSCLYE